MHSTVCGTGERGFVCKASKQRQPSAALHSAGKYRRYNYASLRDLLRVIRNKHSHFREMPPDLQERLGPIPQGFLAYFEDRCVPRRGFSKRSGRDGVCMGMGGAHSKRL